MSSTNIMWLIGVLVLLLIYPAYLIKLWHRAKRNNMLEMMKLEQKQITEEEGENGNG